MEPIVGSGKYTYRVNEEWQQPPDWLEVKACAVSVDSQDRVYCFNRNDAHPIVIFDRDGKFLSSWGAGLFKFPHAIRIVQEGGQDVVWLCDEHHNRFYKFSPDAKYLFSWGEPGTAPGQFNLPHGVWIDRRGRVLVADRENDRVQVFDQSGKLLDVWPTKLVGVAFFYVDDDDTVYVPEHNAGMISILTLDGERLATWGGPIHRSCHGIWVDSHHDLYVVQPGEWEPRARRVVKYTRQ